MDGTVGEIRLFAGSFAPRSWAFCQGQVMPVSRYTALFSLIGSIYGGNGSSTFALPNLAGRTPVGAGASPGTQTYVLGEQAGSVNVTLDASTTPLHTHVTTAGHSTPGSATITINAVNSANSLTPENNYLGTDSSISFYAPATAPVAAMAQDTITVSNVTAPQINGVTLATAGRSLPHNNMQPYLALNVIICLSGDFPARN
ncbi:Microcystin-dependent protein [Filimonas lacunae]|uniref:Microcystin-dependent protein n=1 Tax=Filimonas lacunae TaxID=477680 RepID=A0A173M9X5_9BACT|nr:tail fiber protein [Filimonas lacunae]BAV04319.1 microcystin dependent protein [Filimonas lacunae]SIT31011.1 Microcystin-dependent protein [Filimonas lacunae]